MSRVLRNNSDGSISHINVGHYNGNSFYITTADYARIVGMDADNTEEYYRTQHAGCAEEDIQDLIERSITTEFLLYRMAVETGITKDPCIRYDGEYHEVIRPEVN